MDNFKVVTLGNLNLREGPGEAFEIVNSVPKGYTLTIVESAKDGGGHKWYKTNLNDGWVKSVYVAQPNMADVNRRVKSDNNTAFSFPLVSGGGIGGGLLNGVAGAAGSIINTFGTVGALLNSFTGGVQASTQEHIMNRRIFGVPHQFIDTTDGRPDDGGPLGIEFTTNIMAETPILSILPGVPDYLAGKSPSEKDQMTIELTGAINDALTSAQREKLNEKNLDMKFFEFEPRCMEYMTYVNTLCRMAATFLGIDTLPVPGYEGTYNYGEFNWFRWHLSNTYKGTAVAKDFVQPGKDLAESLGRAADGLLDTGTSVKDKVTELKNNIANNVSGMNMESLKGVMKGLDQTIHGQAAIMKDEETFKSMNQLDKNELNSFYMDSYYIDFFIKPPSYSESFQNSTTTSKFAESINAASGLSKELQFLMGGAMSLNSGMFDEQVGDFQKNAEAMIGKVRANENVKTMLSRLITGSTSVITGANLIFPEIWESSQYSRDFSMEITLSTPYGTRESIFLNIIVPMMFIVALVLPRQVTVNSYSAPFLVRCTVPGFFTCDMGIVKDVAISKGGPSGDSWTKDGLPTEVTITINIGDLYNALSMSNYTTPKDVWNFIWNTPLIAYVGTMCGLNMRSSELKKKLMVIWNLTRSWPSDRVDYAYGSLGEMMAMARTRVLGAKG
jgi:hypothetical protein